MAVKKTTAEKEADIRGQVHELRDLVVYQKGSIVSRTLVDRKTGTVTLFAFDRGQGLSEHTAPYDAMVCVLDGEVEITISGRPFSLKGGDMIIMPAREPHALRALKRFKMLLVMIRG
ncbi:MAG TPA: cupin domain-containing protein [Syntrophales bacterium]|nr:cupin domain-containing protein [Syntrophales bacterium]HOX95025.1 cupin domain-containing protein [Syntrophales bacterium]HPI57292.1 cupin domain-containing protein [Syntrophales bacterium]HPN25172.1 cupin domain-containing protein [Syntrophales bacterium]HQM29408.1 cupin domain-containing protein [Syntrophales bacterium]